MIGTMTSAMAFAFSVHASFLIASFEFLHHRIATKMHFINKIDGLYSDIMIYNNFYMFFF